MSRSSCSPHLAWRASELGAGLLCQQRECFCNDTCSTGFILFWGLPRGGWGWGGLPPAGHTQRNQATPTAGGSRQSCSVLQGQLKQRRLYAKAQGVSVGEGGHLPSCVLQLLVPARRAKALLSRQAWGSGSIAVQGAVHFSDAHCLSCSSQDDRMYAP